MTATRLALVLVLLATVAEAAPPTAPEVLAKIEATYKQPSQLSAAFTQTTTNATFGTKTASTGTVALAKPIKFRFDYAPTGKQKHGRSFVFDGKTLWVIEPKNLEITVQPIASSTLPVALTFFTGNGSLATQFTPAFPATRTYDVAGALVLQLTAKQPSAQYKELYLVVDPATWQVIRTVVIDSSGNTNTLAFTKVDLAAAAPARTFAVELADYPDYKITRPPATKP